MASIWEDENRFRLWLKIEILAVEAMGSMGRVPGDAVERIRKMSSFDVARIHEIDKLVKHDVIAFLSSVEEYIGEDSAYLHMGLTSSDILDTAFACQLKEASTIILRDIKEVVTKLEGLAAAYLHLPAMGRTHGIHGEPITFGLKFLSWYEEMKRNLKRMRDAREEIRYGKLSGALGTFANVEPEVEAYVMKKLGLKGEPVSTQVVPRDRHARFFSTLALIGSSLERFAVEIRHLQRTEVAEVEEFFSLGQKGSSAMPHKKNPILSENISGLARLLRGYALTSMENVALWHERDISHSSTERVIGPDGTILLDFMLNRFIIILDSMVLKEENIKNNINKSHNLFFSQRLMLALASKGVGREEAYGMVQKRAMEAWRKGRDFKSIVGKAKEIGKLLTMKELEEVFNINYYFRNVDAIFERSTGGRPRKGRR